MHRRPALPGTSSAAPLSLRGGILGIALILGVAAAFALRMPEAAAGSGASTKAAPPSDATTSGAKAPPAGERGDFGARLDFRTDEGGRKVITIEKSGDPDSGQPGRSKVITIDKSGIVVEDGRDAAAVDEKAATESAPSKRSGKRGKRSGASSDEDLDSFDRVLERQPALGAMIVGVVAVVFLAPVLAIALILVYRFRRLRMQNEAMLKLAEKGVVPPAEALDALATGKPGPVLAQGNGTKPLYEQARRLRQRAAWSDLRKGTVMGGIGLALTLYSMINSGSANAIGLILLFVGIGYVLLWWFEDRQARAQAAPASAPVPPAAASPVAPPPSSVAPQGYPPPPSAPPSAPQPPVT
jgi:hypothetical protein